MTIKGLLARFAGNRLEHTVEPSLPRIELSKIATELQQRYDVRRVGSNLCFRPSRQGSWRPDPGDRRLASAIRSYVDRIGRSDGWHAGIVQDFKSYLLADAPVLDQASELLSNNPQLVD